MTTPEIIGLAAMGVVVALLLLSAVSRLALYFIKGPLEDRIAAHYGPDEVLMKDLAANSFGLESKGVWQGRGNGGLVLSGGYLHFFRFPSNNLSRAARKGLSGSECTNRSRSSSELSSETGHDGFNSVPSPESRDSTLCTE